MNRKMNYSKSPQGLHLLNSYSKTLMGTWGLGRDNLFLYNFLRQRGRGASDPCDAKPVGGKQRQAGGQAQAPGVEPFTSGQFLAWDLVTI